MRRKTIGRNPLDQLGPARPAKGKAAKKAAKDAPALRSEIREALLKRPRREGVVTGWFKSVLGKLAG